MKISFWVVDESALGEDRMQLAAQQGPDAVVQAIVANAGPWGGLAIDPDTFAQLFQILDEVTETPDFLVDLAFAGSPHLVLTGHPGPWRLGYFEASLVQHLQPVFNLEAERIEPKVEALGPVAREAWLRLRQSLDEAFVEGRAVAIVHEA